MPHLRRPLILFEKMNAKRAQQFREIQAGGGDLGQGKSRRHAAIHREQYSPVPFQPELCILLVQLDESQASSSEVIGAEHQTALAGNEMSLDQGEVAGGRLDDLDLRCGGHNGWLGGEREISKNAQVGDLEVVDVSSESAEDARRPPVFGTIEDFEVFQVDILAEVLRKTEIEQPATPASAGRGQVLAHPSVSIGSKPCNVAVDVVASGENNRFENAVRTSVGEVKRPPNIRANGFYVPLPPGIHENGLKKELQKLVERRFYSVPQVGESPAHDEVGKLDPGGLAQCFELHAAMQGAVPLGNSG